MKTWGGRFDEPPAELAADFGRDDEPDRELLIEDLEGSIAHVRGLAGAGVISDVDEQTLVGGLNRLLVLARAGEFEWDQSLEDVHANIEAALEALVGPLAGKLHTGRSRNDQVSTDLRLWLRRRIDELDEQFLGLERSLVSLGLRHRAAVMPGHTHLQPAQPVLFAHHLLAHVEMLERDRDRLADVRRRVNVSPLGSGALAGAGFPLDREAVARELGFEGITRNSIDASGDRDFVAEALFVVSLAMVHLSRLAEEVAWWSNPRFGFLRPSDAFSTGSSMMPNKRNPDSLELVRGRAAAVTGQLTGVLALLKGLPLGYQRDLQEVKQPLIGSVRVLRDSLELLAALVKTLHVDEARMREASEEGHTTATALADALVDERVAFRAAHHVVGALVQRAEQAGLHLAELPEATIREALAASPDEQAQELARDPHAAGRFRAAASVEAALARCTAVGGTAPERVAAELDAAARRLGLDAG